MNSSKRVQTQSPKVVQAMHILVPFQGDFFQLKSLIGYGFL